MYKGGGFLPLRGANAYLASPHALNCGCSWRKAGAVVPVFVTTVLRRAD